MSLTDDISLREWAAELEAAALIARKIAGTAFLPESHYRYFRDDHGRVLDGKDGRAYRVDLEATTATAAAAIMTGAELGLKPSAALRSITVINNTPALSALALRAILQHAGHDIWVDPGSNSTKAVVRAKRAGDGQVQESTWTIDRAHTAGLYPGTERGQWRRNPAAMLVARASAEAARWIAADAILGIPYVVEELLDEIEAPEAAAAIAPPAAAIEPPPAAVDGQAAAPAEAPKRRRRKSAATSAPPALPTGPRAAIEGGDPLGLDGGTEVVDPATGEAHVEPAEVAAANAEPIPAEADEGAGLITKPMLDKLHAGLRAIGVGDDRVTALALVSTWAGRPVDSTTKLTTAETHTVLDRLGVLRSIVDDLDFIEIPGPDRLALVSAWAGRTIEAVPDLTNDEAGAVAERLASLRSVARKPEGDAAE